MLFWIIYIVIQSYYLWKLVTCCFPLYMIKVSNKVLEKLLKCLNKIHTLTDVIHHRPDSVKCGNSCVSLNRLFSIFLTEKEG